ncbi:hypothetical protein UAJ10_19265 [Nitrospirillum sp. BR 11164]|nr:hypothetical protein [Nitrospirillum sp. BR 11164]MEA1651152.1 hypothetical protein [Nitrospirillum sp. BR 11164]
MGDAPASLRDEMRGGQRAHRLVVVADEMGLGAREPSIQQNAGCAPPLDLPQAVHGRLGGGQHDHIHLPGQQIADLLPLRIRLFIGGGDQQPVSVGPDIVGDGLGDAREERMEEVGDDQADGPGLAGDQRPRHQVRLIPQLRHPLQHAAAGRFPDIRMRAQGLGHRDDRQPQFQRDVFHAGGQDARLSPRCADAGPLACFARQLTLTLAIKHIYNKSVF